MTTRRTSPIVLAADGTADATVAGVKTVTRRRTIFKEAAGALRETARGMFGSVALTDTVRLAAHKISHGYVSYELLGERFGVQLDESGIDSLTTEQLAELVLEYILLDTSNCYSGYPAGFRAACRVYGVDLEAIESKHAKDGKKAKKAKKRSS